MIQPNGQHIQKFLKQQMTTIVTIIITTICFLAVFLGMVYLLEKSGKIKQNIGTEITDALSGVDTLLSPERSTFNQLVDISGQIPANSDCAAVTQLPITISAISNYTINAQLTEKCSTSLQYTVTITKPDKKLKQVVTNKLVGVRDIALLADKNHLVYQTVDMTGQKSVLKRYILDISANKTSEIPYTNQCSGDVVALGNELIAVLTQGEKIANTDVRYRASICIFSLTGAYKSKIEADLQWLPSGTKFVPTVKINFLGKNDEFISVYGSFISQTGESECGALIHATTTDNQDFYKVYSSFESDFIVCPSVKFDTTSFLLHQSDINYQFENSSDAKAPFLKEEWLQAPKID